MESPSEPAVATTETNEELGPLSIKIPLPETTELFCLLSPSALPNLQTNSDIQENWENYAIFLRYPTTTTVHLRTYSNRSQSNPDRSIDIEDGGFTVSRSPTFENPVWQDTVAGHKGQLQVAGATGTYDVQLLAKLYLEQSKKWVQPEGFWIPDKGDAHVDIMYIRSLDKELLQIFFEDTYRGNPPVENILSPPERTSSLNTGLRLRAPDEKLAFFIGMPYLGSHVVITATSTPGAPVNSVNEPLTLYQYGGDQTNSEDSAIVVWQAYHIIVDKNRIALFKSPFSPFASHAPLFSFQEHLGAFHTLAQLLGNLFLHEEAPLSALKISLLKELGEFLITLQQNTNGVSTTDLNNKFNKFDKRLTDVSMILNVIHDQLKILENFCRIIDNHRPPNRCYVTRNAVQLPLLVNSREQNTVTRFVLEALIKGRTTTINTLKEFQMGVRERLRDARERLKEQQMEERKSQKGEWMKGREKQAGEKLGRSKEMVGILNKQGQTVTVFTYLTAAFLPLGFFSTYLGMSKDSWSGIDTHEEFWRITGPLTVFLVALLSYFMFRKDDDIKDDISKFIPCWKRGGSEGGEGANREEGNSHNGNGGGNEGNRVTGGPNDRNGDGNGGNRDTETTRDENGEDDGRNGVRQRVMDEERGLVGAGGMN